MLTVFLIFIVLLAFIFLGFPIFMSLLITGILFLTLGGNSLGLTVIKMFGSANSLSLLAIPYFVIAGNIIMKARITDKLVNFADAAVGWLPGGLGHVNVLTSMILSLIHICFVSVLHHDPLRLGEPDRPLGFIAHPFVPPLHQIPGIGLVVEHLVDGPAAPQRLIGRFPSQVAAVSVLLLVRRGARHPLLVQNLCDLVGSHAAESHGVDPLHHLRRLRVDLKSPLHRWVFPVAIQRKGGNVLPLLPLVVQHRTDIDGQILQIPLVDQTVDLPGLFVGGIVGIHMVHHLSLIHIYR